MQQLLDRRSEIYDFFHDSKSCQSYFLDRDHEDLHAAYYTSMFLIQDTGESITAHRERGFSKEFLIPYIEFWGVMQALVIQQDAISELHFVFLNEYLKKPQDLEKYNLINWRELRELRNECAGHPIKKDRPKSEPHCRSFMGRSFGGYDEFFYEKFQLGTGGKPFQNTTFPKVNLGKLMDDYDQEASGRLSAIFDAMKQRWR